MMPIKKKRVRLSVEEKIWILNHRKENPMISQNKIALDFTAKLKKTVDRTCVTKVFQKSDQLLVFSKNKKYYNNYKSWGRTTYICIRLNHDEMVILEFIPEIEEQKLHIKPKIQSCVTQFFENNKW